jgi:acetyltransferase
MRGPPVTVRNLDRLLTPRSVALVGATDRPGAIGRVVMERLLAGGFSGPIGLVNPGRDAVLGHPCARRVPDLPFPPDLGVVTTPPAAVPGVIADLGAAGARAAVVITAGVDGPSGLRQAMLDAARPHNLRVLGPNCIGLQAPALGLDASFSHLLAAPGDLALLSQSGAIVTAMLDWAAARGVGFSTVASLGDMADVDVGDLLDHLAADRATRAVLVYLEAATQARKFMSAARSCARVKPVIVVKSGRSAAAARAAASHTGALAGADDVYDAALRRAGLLRVRDLQDMFDAAEALAREAPLRGDRLAIVTNGGGAGVLAVDALADAGGRLAGLAPETIARLNGALPATWSGANPVDVIGDADADRYGAALEAALADPGVDAVLALCCPTALAPAEAIAQRVADIHAARTGPTRKPVLTCWLGEATAAAARRVLSAAGTPTFATPAQAVGGFAHLADHAKAQAALTRTPPSLPDDLALDPAAARAAIAPALAEGRAILTEPEAKAMLAAYGVPVTPTLTAECPAGVEVAAARLIAEGARGVVVKILSRDVTHKSDVGGVRLNLSTPAEAAAAAKGMARTLAERRPEARLDGFAVQPMIARKGAHELILGVAEDPTFGPVMMVGAGGVAVEATADRALELPPLDLRLAADMIGRTRIARLLRGWRGRPAADLDAVALALVRLSHLAADFAEIAEIDVNPLLADPYGAIALDARVVLRPAAAACLRGGNPRFALRPWPSEWDRPEATRDGRTVRIRPVRPGDGALYDAFFDRMAPEDMRRRFMSAIRRLPTAEVARLTQLDYDRAMAFVALDEDGSLLGVSRLATDPDRTEAEFAVLVRSDAQGRGLGPALMRRLLDYARAEGLGRVYGHVDGRNAGMLAMCARLGFIEGPDTDEPDWRLVEITP